jgi:hypothetical protein
MGLFCCLCPSAAEAVVDVSGKDAPSRPVEHATSTQQDRAAAAAPGQRQEVVKRDVDKPWSKLNETESTAVKQTLLKVRRSGAGGFWRFVSEPVIISFSLGDEALLHCSWASSAHPDGCGEAFVASGWS